MGCVGYMLRVWMLGVLNLRVGMLRVGLCVRMLRVGMLRVGVRVGMRPASRQHTRRRSAMAAVWTVAQERKERGRSRPTATTAAAPGSSCRTLLYSRLVDALGLDGRCTTAATGATVCFITTGTRRCRVFLRHSSTTVITTTPSTRGPTGCGNRSSCSSGGSCRCVGASRVRSWRVGREQGEGRRREGKGFGGGRGPRRVAVGVVAVERPWRRVRCGAAHIATTD